MFPAEEKEAKAGGGRGGDNDYCRAVAGVGCCPFPGEGEVISRGWKSQGKWVWLVVREREETEEN